MSALAFTKYEGLGNDFVVVDATDPTAFDQPRVAQLCERHFGIGADGVILVLPPATAGARARMLVLNADGSRPEMCGNGLRCVALHLALKQGLAAQSFAVDTDAGTLAVALEPTGAVSARVQVDMGRATLLEPHHTRFGLPSGEALQLSLSRISTGNPHAVLFDRDFDLASIDRLGPQVSAEIPGGANVEVVQQRGPRELEVVVWERGVGRTLACGTGACAVVAAAASAGRVAFAEPVTVRLPGGELAIEVAPESYQLRMTGPARLVFRGEVGGW